MANIDVHGASPLDLAALRARWNAPIGTVVAVDIDAVSSAHRPAAPDDVVRKAVRDLLRQGGFKPTGRSKPASEFLLGAEAQGEFPTINPPIDLCNRVSLHSGLPISALDEAALQGQLQVRLGAAGEAYVFNAAGHAIDLEGLLCLCDAAGPCANAVKDAQRTKTRPGTTGLLIAIWGTRALPELTARTAAWLTDALVASGAQVEPLTVRRHSL